MLKSKIDTYIQNLKSQVNIANHIGDDDAAMILTQVVRQLTEINVNSEKDVKKAVKK